MGLKNKALGLCAVVALSLGIVAPASAQSTGTVNVSVTIQDAGTGTITFALLNGSNADFGTVPVDAVGEGGGVVVDDPVTFQLGFTGDDKLFRPGGALNIKLGTGADADAFLDLTGGDPTFVGSTVADFQIPGRFLEISAMNNPQQAKYTGASTSPSTAAIWDGTSGRAPREAGSVGGGGQPIYKVGDIGGTFNNPGNSACNVTTTPGNVLVPWPSTGCGVPAFSEGNVTKQIAYIYDGSGFVSATHDIELTLTIPAGVHAGTYTGVLTLESTFS